MKKLVSVLLAVAMMMALMVLPVLAEEEVEVEYQTETITSLDGYRFDSTLAEGEEAIAFTDDMVNGVSRPVIQVPLVKGKNRDFGIFFDDIPDGKYRLTATYRCPVNPGQGRFGLRRGDCGGTGTSFADNSPQGVIKQNSDYVTVTRDVTIAGDDGNTAQQYARIRFHGCDDGYCYIAEFKLQAVAEDGTPGNNILPEFYTKRYKAAPFPETNPADDFKTKWQLNGKNDNAEVVYDTVNGIYKPVLRWQFNSGSGSQLINFLPMRMGVSTNRGLPKGDYRISLTYYSPKNPGNGKLGLRNTKDGGFPSNTPNPIIVKNTGYETVTRDVTVTDESVYQTISMYCENGDGGYIYISELKLQRITIVDDVEILGENLVTYGNFMIPKQYAYEATNLMFDIVDATGDSLTGGDGITVIPPTDEEFHLGASANVKNNGDEAISPVLILAMYYDEALYDMASLPVTIQPEKNETVKISLLVPSTVDKEKLTAKAFIWEEFGNMKPVIPCLPLESGE